MLEVVWKRRFDWLIVEQGDGDQRQWGLGCRTCRKLHEQRQIAPNATRAAAALKDSVFIHCRVGQKGKLQVCTFVNHTTRECHSEAVRAELEQANPRPAETASGRRRLSLDLRLRLVLQGRLALKLQSLRARQS